MLVSLPKYGRLLKPKKNRIINRKQYRLCTTEDRPLSYTESCDLLLENELLPDGKTFDEFKKLNLHLFQYTNENNGDETIEQTPDEYADEWILATMATVSSIHSLNIKPGNNILDIGSGTGYTSALLARIAAPNGKVVGIEVDEDLVDHARKSVRLHCEDVLDNITFVNADASQGYEAQAPYDAVFVGGCVEKIPPVWFDQMKVGGNIVLALADKSPEKEPIQVLRRITKTSNTTYISTDIMDVEYEKLQLNN